MPATAELIKLTYDDYCLLPDDGRRHEIIDGEHYVSPSPSTRHQRISLKLARVLADFVERQRLGEILEAPIDVVLHEHDVVQPDILFVSRSNAHIVTEKNIQGTPDLVIEILSESNRRLDELVKRSLYQRSGVAEYWIVDPDLDAVKIYRRLDEGFVRAAELSMESGDRLETPLFPGFSADLAALFPPRR